MKLLMSINFFYFKENISGENAIDTKLGLLPFSCLWQQKMKRWFLHQPHSIKNKQCNSFFIGIKLCSDLLQIHYTFALMINPLTLFKTEHYIVGFSAILPIIYDYITINHSVTPQ